MQSTSTPTSFIKLTLRSLYLNIFGALKKPKPGIHIINSHYVTPDIFQKKTAYIIFESFLRNLQKGGKFINLDEATNLINSNLIPEHDILIAFTFDDGFEECYTVIAPLLEKYNCRGAFFVNANYIDSDENYQEEFNKRVDISTKKPMNWEQLIDLHKRGHIIGGHGLDHYNFAELEHDQIVNQIIANKKILEDKLNYKCEYFAWTYGQLKHFPKKALRITEKYYKYIFSGTDYKNYFSYDGRVINRRHLEPYWEENHINYFISINKK